MNKIILLLVVFLMPSCSPEQNMSERQLHRIITVTMPSKLSDKALNIKMPACFFLFHKRASVNETNIARGSITLEYPLYQWSPFDGKASCPEKFRYSTEIYAIDPASLDDELRNLSVSEYLLNFQKGVGASYLAENNQAYLYTVSPTRDAIFLKEGTNRFNRALAIDFVRYNPETPNSSFAYFFHINTLIHGEFELKYTVLADDKQPNQFAEKLRRVIENNENVLSYMDIIQEFVENNEKVATFFEKQSTLINFKANNPHPYNLKGK